MAAVINEPKEMRVTSEYRDNLNIKCSSILQLAVNLSGGNQQKVVLSKWLFASPEILILDEPTRGIDVGAKYEIYTIINRLASEGKGIILISSELPEILGVCDRIYVMREGKIVGEMPASEASQEIVMKYIMTQQEVMESMKTLSTLFKNNVREYGMLIALIAVMVFFQFQTDGILLKPVNITNLVLQNSYVITMALGMLLIIVAGWIDLSVGSVVAVVGALAARVDGQICMSIGLWSLLISLMIGAAIGAFQGYWVAYLKIPAFIVTLAGMLIFRGLTMAIASGRSRLDLFRGDFKI